MNVTIYPTLLRGKITPPPSKSQAHRLIIAAALAEGKSAISNIELSRDIAATISCMRALGADVSDDGKYISGIVCKKRSSSNRLSIMNCGESGSTLRFLIPVALSVNQGGTFVGQGRLMQRPLGPYEDMFSCKGISLSRSGNSLTVKGKLIPGDYLLPGDISSQFITGLMYALPLLDGDSRILLTTTLESSGYVDMTIDALRAFGIRIESTANGWFVPGRQHYHPYSCSVEADYSQAGFFYAANGIGCNLDILNLNPSSSQGDRVIIPYYKQLCGTDNITLDVSQCPDLVPPLSVHAALRGEGRITKIAGAARLRMKESDRLSSVTAVLNTLGADIAEFDDALIIRGHAHLAGGIVDAYNDHRIAMMAAIAACRCDNPVTICGAECVSKSYPGFWEDYESLGGRIRRAAE